MKKPLLFLIPLCLFLSACISSNRSADNSTSDQDKKLIAANANIQLGMNYLQDKNVEIAKQKLLLALSLAPKYPPAWYTMAYYWEVTGNTQKANDYYLRAIALAPKNGDSLNNYGTFLCHSGQAKQSIHYFLAAIKDPNYIETSAAYENAGLCALRIPDINQAKNYFSKALITDPNRDRSLFELASINYQQGNYVAAKQQIQSLVLLHKVTPEVASLQAKLYQRT